MVFKIFYILSNVSFVISVLMLTTWSSMVEKRNIDNVQSAKSLNLLTVLSLASIFIVYLSQLMAFHLKGADKKSLVFWFLAALICSGLLWRNWLMSKLWLDSRGSSTKSRYKPALYAFSANIFFISARFYSRTSWGY